MWKNVVRVGGLMIVAVGLSACPNSTKRIPIKGTGPGRSLSDAQKAQGGEASLAQFASDDCLSLINLGNELNKAEGRAFMLTTRNVEIGTKVSAASTSDFIVSKDIALRGQALAEKANQPVLDIAYSGTLHNFMSPSELLGLWGVSEQTEDCKAVTFASAVGTHKDFAVVTKGNGRLMLASDGETRTYEFKNQGELLITVTEPSDLKACSASDSGTLYVRKSYSLSWNTQSGDVRVDKDYLAALGQHIPLPNLLSAHALDGSVSLDYGQYQLLQALVSTETFTQNECK